MSLHCLSETAQWVWKNVLWTDEVVFEQYTPHMFGTKNGDYIQTWKQHSRGERVGGSCFAASGTGRLSSSTGSIFSK